MSIQIRCHDYGHDWPLKAGLRQETPLLIMRKPRAEFMESGSNSDRRLLEYVRKLAAQHVVDREKCDDNVYAELEQLREELLTNLKWTEQVMEMLGRPVPKPVGAVTPPPVLDSIRGFLRSAGCPQPVELVIRAVGEQRRRDFPGLTRPFADVSKSLQYHDRTDGEVVCVRWGEDGRLERVSLKKIKLKSGSRRGRQQGWIWFRDKIETYTPIANYS